jgi:acyl-CoA thioester hydrolase
LPERVAPAFEWPVRVYWEDTDAGGIVFYANYLKFFERARTEWLRSLGIEQGALRQRTGGMFVVSQTALQYLQPARLDDELIVTAALVKYGRGSLWIEQQARRKVCATILCEASIRIGWVDANFKPARIPSCVLQRLGTSS